MTFFPEMKNCARFFIIPAGVMVIDMFKHLGLLQGKEPACLVAWALFFRKGINFE